MALNNAILFTGHTSSHTPINRYIGERGRDCVHVHQYSSQRVKSKELRNKMLAKQKGPTTFHSYLLHTEKKTAATLSLTHTHTLKGSLILTITVKHKSRHCPYRLKIVGVFLVTMMSACVCCLAMCNIPETIKEISSIYC